MSTPEEKAAEKAAIEAAAEKAETEKVDAEKEKSDKDKSEKIVTVKVELPKVDTTKQYSGEDVQKMIQDAVKAGSVNAKNQLHEEIDKLKTKISENEDKAKLNPESEKLRNENVEMNTKLKILEDEIAKSFKKTQELEKTMLDKDLAVIKAQLIAEASGQTVPEMIVGNTAEELKASAEKATIKYKEIQAKIRQSLNLPAEAEKEKTAEEIEKETKLEITRIDPRDPKAVKSWEQERKALVEKIYEQYGVKG